MHRRLLRVLLSVGLATSAMAFSSSGSLTSGQCWPLRYTIYDNGNFGAPSMTLCFNAPDLGTVKYGGLPWQTFNNNISSVKNNYADSRTAYFYDDPNYQNLLIHYSAGTTVSYVGDSLNDRYDSVYIGVAGN